jgi:hypothetical protein
MTETQKPAPKGSNGTGNRVTVDSVEKGQDGTAGAVISGSNNRHNGTTKSTTPQKTPGATNGSGTGTGNGASNGKDASAAKASKKRRKVNHGSWPYLFDMRSQLQIPPPATSLSEQSQADH